MIRWKVVTVRDGKIEAMFFEGDDIFIQTADVGVLLVTRRGSYTIEVVHLFAPGQWLEAFQLEAKP